MQCKYLSEVLICTVCFQLYFVLNHILKFTRNLYSVEAKTTAAVVKILKKLIAFVKNI